MEKQAKDGTFYTQVGPDEWSPVLRTAKDGTTYKKVGVDQWSPVDISSFSTSRQPVESEQNTLPDISLKGLIKGTAEILPTAGMITGGIAGNIPGAAFGGAAGYAGKNLIKGLMGDDVTRSDVYFDPVMGAVEGATSELGGQAITKAGKGLLSKAGESAKYLSARALGAERGTVKSIGEKKIQQAGQYAIDEGIISPLKSTKGKVTANEKKLSESGRIITDTLKRIDEANAATINPLDLASIVDKELSPTYRSALNRSEVNQFENTLDAILQRGDRPVNLQEIQSLKEELGSAANWKNKIDITAKEQMARDAYRIVTRELDNAIDKGAMKIGDNKLLSKIQEARKTYSAGKTAEELLENKSARELGNRIVTPSDMWLLGPAGAGVFIAPESLPYAASAFVGKKIADRYGSQTAAKGLMSVINTANTVENYAPRLAESFARIPPTSASKYLGDKVKTTLGLLPQD